LINLDLIFGLFGYLAEVQNDGDKIAKTALQYLENHDHYRFICNFGTIASDDKTFDRGGPHHVV
jgi:maltooligosyltrehalose trehalohydrolase